MLVTSSSARAQDPLRSDAPVTPAGFRVAPAGQELGVPRFATGFQGPLGSALSPDGDQLLSVSSGAARRQSVDLFDLQRGARSDAVTYDATKALGESAFYGVAFSPDGRRAWASGGGQDVVHVLSVKDGQLSETGQIAAPNFPAGLAYGRTPRGPRLYVANNLSGPAVGLNPPGNSVTVIDPDAGTVLKKIDLGAALQPFGVAFARDGRKAYVTNWLGRNVNVIDTTTEEKIAEVALDPDPLRADHPSAIAENPRRNEVYTANANSDTVSVINTESDQVAATIDVALVPGGPKGANPDGLDVSPDGRTLYVAEAGENAVAVIDLDTRRVRGFVPTSWYPADVDVSPDGRRLVTTNTNDSGAGPNPCGPLTPRTDCPAPDPENDRSDVRDSQYSGSMIKGSLTTVRLPFKPGRLRRLTARVRANNQARARAQRKPAALNAIKHVIYVIKENRTYDQVFGSLNEGNGDASLNLFDDRSAPNHRALARRFGLYDNFYADAEASADGHNWATQANSTDYVDKTWPINYSPRPRGSQRAYDFENVPLAQQFLTEPLPSDPSVFRSAAAQTVGYLWDNAWARGVSYRSYGEYTRFPGDCTQPRDNASDTTHLQARFGDPVDVEYPGYNMSCSDHVDREPEWEREFREHEANGSLPALSIVRLPNDHTNGTRAGQSTPESYMADNDLALGRMVDTLSHSDYWDDTVMLVTEDDAQNGPDHVDAHRTLALVISAYNQRGGVDSTHYDTSAMVATAEDLLGLPPMSIVDQRASRMWPLFDSRPDSSPYKARQPEVIPFGQPDAPRNPPTAPMARQSASWDFTKEDATPEIGLNQAIWKSIRGRRSEMPAPRHEHIIGSQPNDEEGESEER
ncbi:MAG: bifunctional YncE family protein/alkaline phosphatase family protein [Solirubrobacterales bacterium]|jgi:YVTN family beta-propeller protein|nr:bifunctional YncE family protein/alkaline phosphatase family protein [Solirubrobacterales bacterium]